MKKADSLYKIKKYPKAYEYSKKAIMLGDTYYSDLYNAACNAALSGNISDEFKWLNLTYHYVEKEADDLLPATKENMSLEQLKKTWMGKLNAPCLFISATKKENLDNLRQTLYTMVKELHEKRYPYNKFLY